VSDIQGLAEEVQALLGAAVDRDYQAATDLVVRIADQHGAQGVYGLCCALAQMVTTFGFGVKRGQGFAGIAVTGPDGRPVNPDAAPAEARPKVWATRFVAAYTNDDSATTVALFETSLADPDGHIAGVAALIGMAADVLRSKIGEGNRA